MIINRDYFCWTPAIIKPPVAPDGWSDLVQVATDEDVFVAYWSDVDECWSSSECPVPNGEKITHWARLLDNPNTSKEA